MNIRAIYFDLDDTLCGYWSASGRGLRAAFEAADIPWPVDTAIEAWRNVFKSFAGEIKTDRWYEHYLESGEPTRTEHMRRMLASLDGDEGMAPELSKQYAFHRDRSLELFPEARSVLEFLHGKFPLGLITNGPADVQRQEISTLGIEQYFGHILIEGEFKIGKPHLQIFEAATSKWGTSPDEMLFVGNAFEHDVQGAKSAGRHSLWINKAEEPNPGTSPQPDAEIVDLWQVVEWLGMERPNGAAAEALAPEAVNNWRT